MLNDLDRQAITALAAAKIGIETGNADALCRALGADPSASHAYIHDSVTATLHAADAVAQQVDNDFAQALALEAEADTDELRFEAQRSAFTVVLGTRVAAARGRASLT
jgi:hypothetical protein